VLDQIDVTGRPNRITNRKNSITSRTGQAVPNFKFLNQSGKSITIEQFRGKVLLVTLSTLAVRLPDYCIRMSRNFATIQKQLAAIPRCTTRLIAERQL